MRLTVFVISLAGATTRRARIATQLQQLGVDFQFIDAVKGRDLPADYLAPLTQRRPLIQGGVAATTPSEIGCALSHVHCADLIVQHHLPGAVILEDDAELLPWFAEFVRQFDPHSPRWQPGSVIILGGLEDDRPGELDRKKWLVPSLFGQIACGRHIRILKSVRSESFFLRTCAYYLDAVAAAKLAAYNRNVLTVADNWLLFSREQVIHALYYPQPWLVRHPPESEMPSQLEPERQGLRPPNGTRAVEPSLRQRLRNAFKRLRRQRFRLLH